MGCNSESIAQDRERVPLCVNYGTSGSGKTTLLFHILHDFEIKQRRGKALYATFGAGWGRFTLDEGCNDAATLLYRRIIESAARRMGAEERNTYKILTGEDWILDPKTVIRVCRNLLKLDDKQDLLIAVDELRMLGPEPEVGEYSRMAVAAMQSLCTLTTTDIVNRKGNGSGAVYVTASAYAAVDAEEGITRGCNRRVRYMPLPPLDTTEDAKTLIALAGKVFDLKRKVTPKLQRSRIFGDELKLEKMNSPAAVVFELQRTNICTYLLGG
eukprot:PhF_6_TR17110/c0_g2_i5/m.26363